MARLTFGIFYDHLVHFVRIWQFFSGFGVMNQGKSGNPAHNLIKVKIHLKIKLPT
jgi:hypothetical protein